MFLFFVGGVSQQVRHVIKPSVGQCIACKSRADLVEYENVLKLFLVPVRRWPGKCPLFHCNTCGLFFPPGQLRCGSCSREIDSEFRFCPFCGHHL